MPIIILIVGAVFLISAVLGTEKQLFTLLRGDFVGPNNFLEWGLAIVFVGAVGYIPGFRPLANAFFVLLIIALLISKRSGTGGGGFFAQLQAALNTTTTVSPTTSGTQAGAQAGNVAGGLVFQTPQELLHSLTGT